MISTSCLAISTLEINFSPAVTSMQSSPVSSSLQSTIVGGWDVCTSLGVGLGRIHSFPFCFFFPFMFFFTPSVRTLVVVLAPITSPSFVILLRSTFSDTCCHGPRESDKNPCGTWQYSRFFHDLVNSIKPFTRNAKRIRRKTKTEFWKRGLILFFGLLDALQMKWFYYLYYSNA